MTDLAHLHDQRQPFEDLESALVKLALDRPGELHDDAVDALRYVIRFAKMHQVRNAHGVDVDVSDRLRTLGRQVIEKLSPGLLEHDDLWHAMRSAPELLREVRDQERRIYQNSALDPDSLHAEVCTRQLVVACSGGGGSGYGYAGAWTLLHRRGLQPELIAGTSIGALMSLFRARRRVYDGVPLIEASKRLGWDNVFRVLETESRYGIPATLRLYLRAAIGSLFQTPDGRPLTFQDLEIPLLVVATGIGIEAFKYDMKYYEHFMDDAVSPGALGNGVGRMRQFAQIATIFRDFMSTPDALREVVFGGDPATYAADILDAAGFSASIPGLIHYDVLRDDRRMKALLDDLYSRYGITRLSEGGLVNNLPVRPAWNEVQNGRIGRRNAFVLALDCFSPRLRYPLFYPIQQIVRPNVQRNIPYANLYFPMQRVLSPLNLVPALPDVTEAMRWTMEEMAPHMPFIERMCNPIRELPRA